MVDGARPKPLQDVAGGFVLAMVAGGILLGWLRNRGRPNRGGEGLTDGSTDDAPHPHGWWSGDGHDGGHHDGGGDGGDGGH